MSTRKYAPTLSAIARKRAKSMCRGYAEPPAMISLGLCSRASASTWS
jgi:hypothetical protein